MWSQRKRKLDFFRKSIIHICRALLTISVAEWSGLISCHRCLFLIHVISPILKKDCTIMVKKNLTLVLRIQRQSRSCFCGSFLESTEITSFLQTVLSCLTGIDDISTAFPNLSKVAAILEVLPVTTATVERSFSSMKLIKTTIRSEMGKKPFIMLCAYGSKAQIGCQMTLWSQQ